MIDLGQTLFRKHYFFQRFEIHQILLNPKVGGYPPLFLLCRERRGKQLCEFIIGLDFSKFNDLLMQISEGEKRIDLAEAVAEQLIESKPSAELSVSYITGKPLVVSDLDLFTRVRRFLADPKDAKNALYYFQVVED